MYITQHEAQARPINEKKIDIKGEIYATTDPYLKPLLR